MLRKRDTRSLSHHLMYETPANSIPHLLIGLAGLVVPLLAASIFISSYMFMKGVTFGAGFAFFGDPVIQRGLDLLNRKFPHWQKLLEVRNTILKGVSKLILKTMWLRGCL